MLTYNETKTNLILNDVPNEEVLNKIQEEGKLEPNQFYETPDNTTTILFPEPDSELSVISENSVQNKTITLELQDKVSISQAQTIYGQKVFDIRPKVQENDIALKNELPIPNNGEETTETLTSLKIDGINYNIASSGSGGSGSGIIRKVLWENTNPTPTGEFTITTNEDMSNYDYIEIVWTSWTGTSTSFRNSSICKYGIGSLINITNGTGNNNLSSRECVIESSTTIKVSQGYYDSVVNNDVEVPYQVIGIKFVGNGGSGSGTKTVMTPSEKAIDNIFNAVTAKGTYTYTPPADGFVNLIVQFASNDCRVALWCNGLGCSISRNPISWMSHNIYLPVKKGVTVTLIIENADLSAMYMDRFVYASTEESSSSNSGINITSTDLATPSSVIVDGACRYIEFGDFVIINIQDVKIGTAESDGTILFSNLPKPLNRYVFAIHSYNKENGNSVRLRIDPDGDTGTISTHWSNTSAFNNTNCQLYGTYVYLKDSSTT